MPYKEGSIMDNNIYYIGKEDEFLREVINSKYNFYVLKEEDLKKINNEIIFFDSMLSNIVKGNNKFISIEDFKLDLIRRMRNLYAYNYDLYYLYYKLKGIEYTKEIDSVIVGLSYSLFGIIENEFNKKTINLSLASQDIYYACLLAKESLKKSTDIKRIVINLAYYSFNFDLSRAKSECYRISRVYYPLLNEYNYYSECPNLGYNLDLMNNYIKLAYKDIFNFDRLECEISKEVGSLYFHDNITREGVNGISVPFGMLSEDNKEKIAINRAASHSVLLQHSYTINDNLGIVLNLLEETKEKNIEVIVLVLPTSKYYSKYSNEAFRKIFYSKINSLVDEYNIKLIDLFNDDSFIDNDFIDSDHLNERGAIKASKLVNSYLMK